MALFRVITAGAFAAYMLTGVPAMTGEIGEIKDRATVEEFGAGVRAAGYHCPYAVMAWNKMPDAGGVWLLVKVFCGPGPGEVYPGTIYRFTIGFDGRPTVTYWGD